MQSARTIIEAGKTSRHTDKGVVDFFFQLSVMLLQQKKKIPSIQTGIFSIL